MAQMGQPIVILYHIQERFFSVHRMDDIDFIIHFREVVDMAYDGVVCPVNRGWVGIGK